MRSSLKSIAEIPRLDLFIVFFVTFIIFTFSALVFSRDHKQNEGWVEAKVVRLIDTTADGGFFYQNVEIFIPDYNINSTIKVPLEEPNLIKLHLRDKIFVQKQEVASAEYFAFVGLKRTNEVLWICIIFVILLLVMLGKDGIKYVFPSFMIALLLLSGALFQILNSRYVGILLLFFLGLISFASTILQTKKIKLAVIVTISQIMISSFIYVLTYILFRQAFLYELYYNLYSYSSSISVFSFFTIITLAIIFISFGVNYNTAIEVTNKILNRKEQFPGSSFARLMREGVGENQKAIARSINSLIFIFIGLSLSFSFAGSLKGKIFLWNNALVTEYIILFVCAGLSILLVGPVTSLICASFLHKVEITKING